MAFPLRSIWSQHPVKLLSIGCFLPHQHRWQWLVSGISSSCPSGCDLLTVNRVVLREKGQPFLPAYFRKPIWHCGVCSIITWKGQWSGRLLTTLFTGHYQSQGLCVQHPLRSVTSSTHYRSMGPLLVETGGKPAPPKWRSHPVVHPVSNSNLPLRGFWHCQPTVLLMTLHGF